jgi:hypothetical protein
MSEPKPTELERRIRAEASQPTVHVETRTLLLQAADALAAQRAKQAQSDAALVAQSALPRYLENELAGLKATMQRVAQLMRGAVSARVIKQHSAEVEIIQWADMLRGDQ